MPGRTFAIGDIHGCVAPLETLLNWLSLTADDTVVVLGDVVDRGPESRAVVESLRALPKACQTRFIKGNHEELFLDSLQGGKWLMNWLDWGGQATVESYGGRLQMVPQSHRDFLENWLDFWETDTEIFVHAQVEPAIPVADQSTNTLRWRSLEWDEPAHLTGKRVVCGHTSQKNGLPRVYSGGICIDTYCWGGQWLSCLEAERNVVWQVSTDGLRRRQLELTGTSWKPGYHPDQAGWK